MIEVAARKCTLHHLKILRTKRDQSVNITNTPGKSKTGWQIAFDDVLKEVISRAMRKGIDGPYQVKIALDSANMTAGRW